MTKLFELLSHNDLLVGLATLAGLIALIAMIWRACKATWKFGHQVLAVGLPFALRQRGYRRALLAYRCAEDPAYFIAIIIEDVLARLLLGLALSTQLAEYYLEGEPLGASKLYAASGVIIICFTWACLMWIFFGFLSKFLNLSRNVRRIIYDRQTLKNHRPVVWRKRKRQDRIDAMF